MNEPRLIEILPDAIEFDERAYLVWGDVIFAVVFFDYAPHPCGDDVCGWTLRILPAEGEWELVGDDVLEAAANAIDSLAEGISA